MLRIAVCDDFPTICSELENIILDFQNQTNEIITVEVFYTGEDLIKYIKNEDTFDLIFLDIELNKINGVEVGQIIRDELDDYITKIVYISSKSHYDRQLFDVQPLHFLPKPLEREKVIRDIRLAMKVLEKENKLFSFKVGHQTHKIPVKEIIYFECLRREVKLVSTKKIFYFYDTLYDVCKRLSKFRFMQPHRSYLINYDNVLSIGKDKIKVCNDDIIPLSRLKVKEIKELQVAYEEERYK